MLFAGAVGLFELASRLLLPIPAFEGFNRVTYSPTYSGIASRSFLRHDSFVIPSEPDNIEAVYKLNLYGFRDNDWPAHARRPRVMFVGDSFVEGYLTDAAHTIPEGFNAAASQQRQPLDVMNFGVTGAGLVEYTQLIYDAVPLFHPRDVVLVLYANDLPPKDFDPRSMAPATFKKSPVLLPRAIDSALRLARHERITPAWHRPPVPYFLPVPSPGNPWTRFAARYTFVEPEFADAMKSGRMNPFIVDEIHWLYRVLAAPMEFEPFLSGINEYLKQNDVRLFVVYIPSRHQVTTHYREYVRAFCSKDRLHDLTGDAFQIHATALRSASETLDIPFLDLTPYLREREAANDHAYLSYDGHFRSETYYKTGELIFDWWFKQE